MSVPTVSVHTEMQISGMITKLEQPLPDEFDNEFNDIRIYASHKEVTQDRVADSSLRRQRYNAPLGVSRH